MSYTILTVNEIEDTAQQPGLGVNTLKAGGPALQTSEYNNINQIKANLTTLFLTAKGERLYHPNFGTNLRQALFEPNTDRIKMLLDPLIKDPIQFWMPYITITTVDITTAEEDPTLDHDVKIMVSYIINGLNIGDTIVLFFANSTLIAG